MRANGLQLVIDLAVSAVNDPAVSRHRAALVLGTLREDVRYLPPLGVLYEHLSLSHFSGRALPGGFIPFLTLSPFARGNRLYAAALREKRERRMAAAFVQLGRVAHLVADMACPVHAHRVIHETDPFEWWVEAHCSELSALPVPALAAAGRPSELIESLARHTQRLAPDRTNNAIGRLLRRFGIEGYSPLPREVLAEQAREIIPLAAGTLAAVVRMFLRAA
jgi:hypothetical protein